MGADPSKREKRDGPGGAFRRTRQTSKTSQTRKTAIPMANAGGGGQKSSQGRKPQTVPGRKWVLKRKKNYAATIEKGCLGKSTPKTSGIICAEKWRRPIQGMSGRLASEGNEKKKTERRKTMTRTTNTKRQ